jgi:hypothetical protein
MVKCVKTAGKIRDIHEKRTGNVGVLVMKSNMLFNKDMLKNTS